MLDATSSLTIQARLPNPYVHVDNRGLILCNGPRCVCIPASGLRACAETLEIIATERRATRTQGQHLVGGYIDGGYVVLYAGHPGRPRLGQPELVGVRRAAPGVVSMRLLLATVAALLVFAAPAGAEEKLLTLYSPPIDSEPYVHKSTTVPLKADGVEAPAEPGYMLGLRRAGARGQQGPGRRAAAGVKMMVHHLLYFTGGRVDGELGLPRRRSSSAGAGRSTRTASSPRSTRPRSATATACATRRRRRRARVVGDRDGHEPLPALQALLRAHEALVHDRSARGGRTRPRSATASTSSTAWPTTCRAAAGPTSTARRGRCPFNARILGGGSHHHGGATRQTLVSKTCNRGLLDAKAYYGAADHPYNTVRPILHEPGPIANGTFGSAQGHPDRGRRGARAHRAARQLLAARRGDGLLGAQRRARRSRDACAPLPGDLIEVTRPAKYDRKAPYVYDREVPQLLSPRGAGARSAGAGRSATSGSGRRG